VNSEKDYRYDLEQDIGNINYLSPANEATNKRLDRIFCRLAKIKTLECTIYFEIVSPKSVEAVEGRNLIVPRSNNGICMYDFK
jgi:predicted ATPase